MYLSILSQEQKRLFFHLAYRVSMCDGDFSEKEELIIKSYSDEAKYNFDPLEVCDSAEDLILKIDRCTNITEKRIFIFELMGLILADYIYDEEEKKIIMQICSQFDIDLKFAEKCQNYINQYLELQRSINFLLMDE